MTKKIKVLFVGVLVSFVFIRTSTIALENIDNIDVCTKVDDLTHRQIVDCLAPKFGQDAVLIKKIIQCESGFRVVKHDGGQATNITGIWDKTFTGWEKVFMKEYGHPLNKNSQYDQIKLMVWAFSKGEEYRNQWTTYRAQKNGGTVMLWSSYYDKYIVVNCK